ncbi:hypothetical protein BD413DRAFT_231522 [Trametes elegans]|nr:hypothetical protein BD413DRAFT_231522 [Trametes elegans]
MVADRRLTFTSRTCRTTLTDYAVAPRAAVHPRRDRGAHTAPPRNRIKAPHLLHTFQGHSHRKYHAALAIRTCDLDCPRPHRRLLAGDGGGDYCSSHVDLLRLSADIDPQPPSTRLLVGRTLSATPWLNHLQALPCPSSDNRSRFRPRCRVPHGTSVLPDRRPVYPYVVQLHPIQMRDAISNQNSCRWCGSRWLHLSHYCIMLALEVTRTVQA